MDPPVLARSSGITDSTLLTIANFTLNDEAGRVEKLDGIETKFYCLKKYDVIASVSVFAIEVFRGKYEVFSFILILPCLEMSEFLPRHSICESKLQRLLKEHMILPIKEMVRCFLFCLLNICTRTYFPCNLSTLREYVCGYGIRTKP